MNSEQLRTRNRNDFDIFNNEARNQESEVKVGTLGVFKTLKNEYPNYNFSYKQKFYIADINKNLKQLNESYGSCGSDSGAYLSPDGGLIFLDDHLILTTESKKQGTNDLRLKENKKKQSMGNAIERACKNARQIENLTSNEEINPMIIFGSGCDFYEGSTIPERIRCLNNQRPFNKIFLHNDSRQNTSLFLRKSPWSINEIYHISLDMATRSMDYYINKYKYPK